MVIVKEITVDGIEGTDSGGKLVFKFVYPFDGKLPFPFSVHKGKVRVYVPSPFPWEMDIVLRCEIRGRRKITSDDFFSRKKEMDLVRFDVTRIYSTLRHFVSSITYTVDEHYDDEKGEFTVIGRCDEFSERVTVVSPTIFVDIIPNSLLHRRCVSLVDGTVEISVKQVNYFVRDVVELPWVGLSRAKEKTLSLLVNLHSKEIFSPDYIKEIDFPVHLCRLKGWGKNVIWIVVRDGPSFSPYKKGYFIHLHSSHLVREGV